MHVNEIFAVKEVIRQCFKLSINVDLIIFGFINIMAFNALLDCVLSQLLQNLDIKQLTDED